MWPQPMLSQHRPNVAASNLVLVELGPSFAQASAVLADAHALWVRIRKFKRGHNRLITNPNRPKLVRNQLKVVDVGRSWLQATTIWPASAKHHATPT